MARSPLPLPARVSNALLLLTVPALALALAGCGTGGDDQGDRSQPANTVAVTLTPDDCAANPGSTPAGATTFKVTNQDASAVSELELLSGDRVLGEKENLTPGLSGSFTLDLAAGSYTLVCPGAKQERTDFTVTGSSAGGSTGTPATSQELTQALEQYRDYVEDQVEQLVAATKEFTDAVRAGDVARAKQLYAPTRVFYERIEPVAETFGDLDPAIDARINDVDDPSRWTGFHRIEQALWERGSTAGMAPVADRLKLDVDKLAVAVETIDYQPAQLANGASELLDEVANSKVTGEEERYSHTDLVDFAANLDGAEKAFTLLEPELKEHDPALASTITDRFAEVRTSLEAYRDGDGYRLYTELTPAQVKELATQVDALAEPLSQVAAKIVEGR
ncbi:MAG TPA: iron uptake system protein EfeO [Mycobacteriales bacterium]